MKIIVAFDSFKGSLNATRACDITAQVLQHLHPEWDIQSKPLADGGEGSAEVLQSCLGGEWIPARVTGPLPDRTVDAGYIWSPSSRTAVIELAKASGLTLLENDQRNPLRTTTRGTGELLAMAMQHRPDQIFLCLGGSATVDAGTGAASALGWQFLDHRARPLPAGGGYLINLHEIIRPTDLDLPLIRLLCDVTNPLTGPEGAAAVYAPQKGATPDMVYQLERCLKHLAGLVSSQLGIEMDAFPGAGAAGGFGGGAVAFLNATLASGIDTIMDLSNFTRDIADADWILTGEGSFDRQSLSGKVVSGVLSSAARHSRTRVGVIAGSIGLDDREVRSAGVSAAMALQADDMPAEESIRRAEDLLAERVEEFSRSWLQAH